jgi:WD40 repeat protein
MPRWPLSQDYNEAIQSPQTSFADPELRAGHAVVNALGMPMPCSGTFADVYQVVAQRTWAVKCFTRQIPCLRERYLEINRHLRQVSLPFIVDFAWLEQGICVHGDWYPVLKMEWVEGFPLNEFVKHQLDRPQVLETLCQVWVKLAKLLREANIGHCDLQHGNVLLVPGRKAGSLKPKLVDYDGMFIPALALLKSSEVGHPAYQHPQRLQKGLYGLEIDRFSHLVIYTAVRALMVGGKALWDKYDNGDNLLFKQSDFQVPTKSPLFCKLLDLGDPDVRRLVLALRTAAQEPLDQTPLLEELAGAEESYARWAETPPSVRAQAVAESPEPMGPAHMPTAQDPFASLTSTKESSPHKPRPNRPRTGRWAVAAAVCCAAVPFLGLLVGMILFAIGRNWGGATTEPRLTDAIADVQSPRQRDLNNLEQGTGKPQIPESGNPPKRDRDPKKTDPAPNVGPRQPPGPLPEVAPPRVSEKADEPRRLQANAGRSCVSKVAFFSNDQFLSYSNGESRLLLWDFASKNLDQPVDSIKISDSTTCVAVCTKTKQIACGNEQGEILLIDEAALPRKREPLDHLHAKAVRALAFSESGDWLVSGAADGKVVLWDFRGGSKPRILVEPTKESVQSIAISKDGRFVICGLNNGVVRFWDMKEGLDETLGKHKEAVCCLVVTPDGGAAIGGGKEGVIWKWDLNHIGNETKVGEVGERIESLVLSPDGRCLVSGDWGKRLRVWDIRAKDPTSTAGGPHELPCSLAVSPNGKYILSGHADGAVWVWPLPHFSPEEQPRSK